MPHAERLATRVTHPVSRWRPVIAVIPRHLFVPRWWSWSSAGSGFDVAAERLDRIGLHPQVITCDATGPLPGNYDRIVSTVAVRPIPASWLSALRPGGRLVTTLTATTLIITADKTDNGGAIGRVEWDRAGFMHTRTGADYPPGLGEAFTAIRKAEGDQISIGRYPVVNVVEAWELWSMPRPLANHHHNLTRS